MNKLNITVPLAGSLTGLVALALGALVACGGNEAKDGAQPEGGAKAATPAEFKAPEPVQEALVGGPFPALMLTQSVFLKDASGKPIPGPARLDIWRDTGDGWKLTRLEDADSNVFHKAIQQADGSLLTIGAEGAILKKWTFADGKWTNEALWSKDWGGKFQRLRDLEIADVNGDGADDYVLATHDSGVVAVIEPGLGEGGTHKVTEMDQKADTFVHEIEIGDVDGDGKMEFFATPSDRNQAGKSQAGGVVMYKWNGTGWDKSWVEEQHGTHAKEILATDLDGDGVTELFSVLEAEIDPTDKRKVISPVTVRQYVYDTATKTFTATDIASIEDRQTRFLVPGDFDGDGQVELVAAAMSSGLFLLEPPAKGSESLEWTPNRFDQSSGGFEHSTYAADLDGDGIPELYVAADTQRELKRYIWNAERGTFDKQLLGRLEQDIITWNITTGSL